MKIAYFLPETILRNNVLADDKDGWTEEKIVTKIGVEERHIVGQNETALDLAERASKKLLSDYSVSPDEIDFLVLCTQSSEYKLPSTSCLLQRRLNIPINSGSITIDHGCSGFVYGLSIAKGLIAGKMADKVLLVTAETYSRYIDAQDLSLKSIFGDGASATLIDAETATKIGQFHFGTDGGGADKLIVRDGRLHMDGPAIFSFTTNIVSETITAVLKKNNLAENDIDLFVFHQANKYMLDTIRKLINLPKEKFHIDLKKTGNTVSSTIPIALRQLDDTGKLKTGMNILLMGFGVGLSWGATVIRI